VTIGTLANPTAPGATANFTAVLNGAVNPTGNVYFCADATDIFDCTGGMPLCTVAVSGGTMACSTNALSAGSHEIRAYFPGDIDNEASSSRLTQLVGTAPAITSANATTFTVGVAGSFTVTTTGTPTPTVNAGVVAFPAGVNFVDNGNGTATFSGTPAFGSVGAYNATLHAQNIVPPQATQTFTLTVVRANQTLTFPPQSPASHAFTAGGTFAISPPATSATPNSGNPIVYSSQTAGICSVAGTTVTMLAIGTCTIAADQAGNADYAAAATVTQNVAIGLTSQTITFGPAPMVSVNGNGSVTATTTATPAANYPIVFSTASADCTVTTAGAVSGIRAGVNNCIIAATQAGDALYASASATQVLSIGKKSTTVALAATPNPATINAAVTLTVTVAGDPPTGAVSFCDGATTVNATCAGGSTLCATVALTQGATNSSATCAVSFASAGTHSLSAYYAGDGNFSPAATGQVLALQVDPAALPAVPAPLSRWTLLLLAGLLIAAAGLARARMRA